MLFKKSKHIVQISQPKKKQKPIVQAIKLQISFQFLACQPFEFFAEKNCRQKFHEALLPAKKRESI